MCFHEMSNEEFSDYCKEISAAYRAEEDEYKMGIHPTQVRERIEKALYDLGFQYEEVTFLDWNIEGPKVTVSTNNEVFGVFNYSTNKFESVKYKKNEEENEQCN